MSRLVVLSHRVATPGETQGSAGGLAVAVFGAMKDIGGVWFGWSGDIVSEAVANAGPTLEVEGGVTFATAKGLVERFRAFERLLENAPDWRGNITLVQIAPPTRSDLDTYQPIRQNLEYEAGRINGRYSALDYTAVRYLNQRYDHVKPMCCFASLRWAWSRRCAMA
jgi:trehalose-6-phosphate synthase